MSVNHSGDRVIIDVSIPSGNLFHTGNAFFLGFMSKHSTLNYVTDGENVFHIGLEMFIDFQLSAFIHVQADIFTT